MNPKYSNNSQAGFTLAEIIVVFAIIALLASIGMGSSFIGSRGRARDTVRKTHLTQISQALEEYVNDYGRYPAASNGNIAGCGAGAALECAWGSQFSDDNGTIYMGEMPIDPRDPAFEYVYRVNSSRSGYQLYARLESEDDPILDRNGDGTGDVYSFVSCGDVGNCNYGISSGNLTPEDNPLP